jgi:hypothetical protein
MHSLRPHERLVLNALLEGDHPTLAGLRQQLEHVGVPLRTHTGVGEYVDLEPIIGSQPVEPRKLILADVNVQVQGVKHGADALLYIVNGLLNVLEFATAADEWPAEPVLTGITFYKDVAMSDQGYALEPTPRRDPATLARALRGGASAASQESPPK